MSKIALGQRIRTIRLNKGLTMEEFGKILYTSKSNVSMWESGRNAPNAERIREIAKLGNVSVSWLITGSEEIQGEINSTVKKTAETMQQLSLTRQSTVLEFTREQLEEQNREAIVNANTLTDNEVPYETSYNAIYVTEAAAAGIGYAYGDNETTLYKTDRFDLKSYDFATLVHGDSMEPKYNNGDVVLIRNGYDNANGAVYVVDYDGKSFLKRVFFEGNRLRLVSYNHDYEDIYINLPIDDDIYLNIIGKVVDSFTPIYD